MSQPIENETPDQDGSQNEVQRARENLRLSKEVTAILGTIQLLVTQVRAYGPQHTLTVAAARTGAEQIQRALQSILDPELDIDVSDQGFEFHTVPLYNARAKVKELVGQCLKKNICRLRLRRGVTDAELVGFVSALYTEANGSDAFAELLERFNGLAVRNIVVERADGQSDNTAAAGKGAMDATVEVGELGQGKTGRRIADARHIYTSLVELVREVHSQVAIGADLDTRDLGVLTGDLAQCMLDYPEWLLPYAMVRRFDRYDLVHPVNTCILALSLITPLLSNRPDVEEIARSILLMTIGEVVLDPDAKTTAGTPMGMAETSLRSAFLLDRVTLLSKMPMVIAFEHQLGDDFSGTPRQPFRWQQNVCSSLIYLCGRFDFLTSAQHSPTLLPHQALQKLASESGQAISPDAMEWMLWVLSPYPPGSLVRLDTGEIAVVLRKHHQPDALDVKVIADTQGQPLEWPRIDRLLVDVSSKLPPRVRTALDANALPLRVIDYLEEAAPVALN